MSFQMQHTAIIPDRFISLFMNQNDRLFIYDDSLLFWSVLLKFFSHRPASYVVKVIRVHLEYLRFYQIRQMVINHAALAK